MIAIIFISRVCTAPASPSFFHFLALAAHSNIECARGTWLGFFSFLVNSLSGRVAKGQIVVSSATFLNLSALFLCLVL
jgi:hypothetical protein